MLGRQLIRTLAVSGLILSATSLYAATAAPIDNTVKLTIPSFQRGAEFSFAALALKPGASNLDYVIYNKASDPAQTPMWSEQELRPTYSAGFELGARYVYPEGEDVRLNWTHLYSSTSSSVAAPNGDYFLGPNFEIGPPALPIRNASGTVTFRYDVVNLDAGQFLSFGQHVVMRFFGGLSTAFLREQVNTTFTGNTVTGLYQGPFSTNQNIEANFTGIGPRFGMEADYNTDHNFSFLGEVGISALIGSSYSKTSYISSAQKLKTLFNQDYNYQTIRDQNVTQVLPGFDAKIGVNYKHVLSNQTQFTVSLGYQAAVYINAINQYLPGSLVSGQSMDTGGIFVATMSHTQSNYSVQGPFLKAAWQF